MRRIEARAHSRVHSVTVSGEMFHGWLEEAPAAGDEVVCAAKSGGIVIYRIIEVSELPGGSFYGSVKLVNTRAA